MITSIVCSILAGVADRIRGGWRGPGEVLKKVRKTPALFEGLVYSLLTMAVLPMSQWFPWVLLVFPFGYICWRQDNGFRGKFVEANTTAYDEKDKHKWYDVVRFGALQGFIVLPLAIGNPVFAYFIHAAILGQLMGMIFSMAVLSKHEDERIFGLNNAWPGSEFFSAMFTGGFWILIMYLVGLFT